MLTSDLFENKTPAAMKSDMAKGLNEFAPPGDDGGNDDDGFDEATLKQLAAKWWNGDEDPRVEQLLMNTGWEIGQDEGYDNGGVFVVMSGDENGDTYLSWPAEELQGVAEGICSECGGPSFSDMILAEKQDACYHKVKSRYKVWPSAYASGALVQCRKKGAANWGNKSEGVAEGFDRPYPIKWEKSEFGDYDALAKLSDGSPLSIMFNLADMSENNWGVEFYRNNSQSVTGEGDAYRVFSTVLTAISQFIKKKKPDTLFFTAVKEEDPTGSRAKLYDRLVQRYATELGYKLSKVDYPEQVGYRLERSQQGVAEGFKNTYNVGDRVDGPLGTGTIVAVSKNINVDGRVKVKLDDPSRAGEDGKYKDSFVLDTTQLKHINEQGVAEGSLNEFAEKPEDGPGSDDYEDLLFHLAWEFWSEDGDSAQAERKLSLLGWKPEFGDDYTAIVLYKIGSNDHRQYTIDEFEEYGEQGVAEGLDQPREAGKAIQSLKNLAVMKTSLTMQQLSQAGREAIVTNAIDAAKTLEQTYLQNKQQGNAIFVRALRDEIDNFMRGSPINASFPETDNASELGDLLQGKLGKVNFQQGVAEGSLEEYGDTAKGQKMLTKVQKRAVDRMIKADDKNRLEPDYTKRDLKTVRKNAATADRAWDRMTDLDEQGVAEGAFDNYSPMAQQQIAKDKNQTLKNTSADEVIRDLIQGSLDGYDVMAHPRTPAQKVVAKMMQDKYDDIAINHRLHPDDDFEEIISRVIDDFEEDYGAGLTEEQDLAEAVSTLELADFLFKGLEQKFPKVVERYGHEVVGDAIMDVAEENQDVNSVSDVDMLIDDIIEKLQNYSNSDSGLSESKVSRLYYNVVGTSAPELRKDFGMRRDSRGWFLSESSGRNRIMDAHRAFGSPKLVEYDLSVSDKGAATLGPDNVVSPIGTVPRGQQLNKKAKSKKV